MVLYRKYRPQKLSEIFGQKKIAEILLASLLEGKIGHGYLFSGPRGTGKTSTARILARAVNCQVYGKSSTDNRKKKTIDHERLTINKFGEPCNKCLSCRSQLDGSNLDLIEIDAASNRGIDEIRDLREKVKLSPVSLRFKVYIIDEAHMLTTEAFNALLKTLEEPPTHAIFILCTTEIEKLPETIISRLARFNFSRASESEIVSVLAQVAKKEGISAQEGVFAQIAKAADGSFRDALSLLDQLWSGKTLKEEDVEAISRVLGFEIIYSFLSKVLVSDLRGAVLELEEIAKAGGDIHQFLMQTVLILEKLLFLKIGIDLNVSEFEGERKDKLLALAKKVDILDLQNLMKLFLTAEGEMKIYPLPQIPLVLAVCKFCKNWSQINEEILEVKTEVKSKAEIPEVKKSDAKATDISTNKKSNKSLVEVEGKWREFLDSVKPINAHVVALLRSTRPSDFDGVNLTLEVFYRFHKERLEEPKIIKMLDENLSKVMGRAVKLKFLLAKESTRPTKTVAASDVSDINTSNLEDLEAIAAEIFSK